MPLICRSSALMANRTKSVLINSSDSIDSKRCQPHEFALARCVLERRVAAASALICPNMNCHMRLENRRIVSAREIIDNSLKEAACRLGRDKPVCNDDLPGHETLPVPFNSISAARQCFLQDRAHKPDESDRTPFISPVAISPTAPPPAAITARSASSTLSTANAM